MKSYTIGLLDDNATDVRNIRISIKENWPDENSSPVFKEYEISTIDAILNEIKTDIVNNKINCLVADYKLVSQTEIIKGDEIVKELEEVFQKFPFIILTVVSRDVFSNNIVDPDRVYDKKSFTNAKREEANTGVMKLYKKILRYLEERAGIEIEKRMVTNEIKGLKGDGLDDPEREMELISRLWKLDFKQSLLDGIQMDNPNSNLIKQSLEELSHLFDKVDSELERINNGEKV